MSLIDSYYSVKRRAERVKKDLLERSDDKRPYVRINKSDLSCDFFHVERESLEYLVKAINRDMRSLIKSAISIAEDDVERARHEARREAEEILQITQ